MNQYGNQANAAAAAVAIDAVRDCMLNYVICVYFHLVMNL